MAKESKKSGKKRATKKSTKKKSTKKKSTGKKKSATKSAPKKKAAKKKSTKKKSTKKKAGKKKSTKTKSAKKKAPKKKAGKRTESRATEKAAAPLPAEPEADIEPPQPPEETRTPPEPSPPEPSYEEPEPEPVPAEPERSWAPEDDEPPADPWAEPEEPSTPDLEPSEPSPWEAPEASKPETPEEPSPWAAAERTADEETEPMPRDEPEPDPWPAADEPEPDPWPAADEDVVTAEPAAPPEPEPSDEPAPWDPVSEETEPEPAAPEPPQEEKPASAGWKVAGGPQPAGAGAPPPEGGTEPAAQPNNLRARFDDASLRMGMAPLAALGWAVFFVGLLIITYAYYDLYAANADSVLLFAGAIRYDVLGAILLLLGLITALVFHFVPTKKPRGPQPGDPPMTWAEHADNAGRWVTTHRTLSIIGWVLAALGLVIATASFYYSWLNSNGGLVDYGVMIAGYQFLYWRIGAALAILGLLVVVLTYTRMHHARQARQAYLLAALAALDRQQAVRKAAAVAQETTGQGKDTVAGVTEEELRALMRRLDGLMSSLPEQQVAEFANSPEAETYLGLLESSK